MRRLWDLVQACWKGEANQQHQQHAAAAAGRLVTRVTFGCNPDWCPVGGSGIVLKQTSVLVGGGPLWGRPCLPVSEGRAAACLLPGFSTFLSCHHQVVNSWNESLLVRVQRCWHNLATQCKRVMCISTKNIYVYIYITKKINQFAFFDNKSHPSDITWHLFRNRQHNFLC